MFFCRRREGGGYLIKTLADKNNVYHDADLDRKKKKNARMGMPVAVAWWGNKINIQTEVSKI